MSAQWNASTQAIRERLEDRFADDENDNAGIRQSLSVLFKRIDELERAILMHVQVSRGTYTHITPSDTLATLALLVKHLEKGEGT